MKEFIEITNNQGAKSFVRTADIVGITELPADTEKLYDELGKVVKETPKDKEFQILIKNEGSRLLVFVDETEYTRVVSELTK